MDPDLDKKWATYVIIGDAEPVMCQGGTSPSTLPPGPPQPTMIRIHITKSYERDTYF